MAEYQFKKLEWIGNSLKLLQGFKGTREHGHKKYWEQGNKRKIKLGTRSDILGNREHKEHFVGNKRTRKTLKGDLRTGRTGGSQCDFPPKCFHSE